MKKLFVVAAVLAAGFANEVNAGWTVQNFDKANHVRPENALSGDAEQKNMFDGDVNTSDNQRPAPHVRRTPACESARGQVTS